MGIRPLALGRTRPARGGEPIPFELPAHHLVTHAACVGMTGSGKTGLCIALLEEALRSRIPVLILDIKGDLPNLGLLFDELDAPSFQPWVDPDAARRDAKTPEEVAEQLATRWREGLNGWGLGPTDVRALRESVALRIITPGTTGAGEPLHVLSPLETGTELWSTDEEAARESLSAALGLLLRMVDRDPDPARGREHVVLAHLAERRLRAGQPAGLAQLLGDLGDPPIQRIGALGIDEFLPPRERASLMQDLNALVASPTFATWQKGAPLDVGSWMRSSDERTPATIVSVAHLEDEERMLVLSLVLEQTLAWVRGLPGTTDLRALMLFDEVFGYMPPHPANPPTKRPLLSLLKQARAFGVGCVLATQNPVDLDYKALSNAGVWFIGRLQTDTDRERVVEGLAGSEAGAGLEPAALEGVIKSLPPRTFFVRNVHDRGEARVLETRWTMSWLRGPMTRVEIRRWRTGVAGVGAGAPTTPAAMDPAERPAAPPGHAEGVPAVPEGWRALYPFPPDAPVEAWSYAPHAVVVARAEIVDTKLGYSESRDVSVMVPIDASGLDLTKAAPFPAVAFRHAPVSGASYRQLGDVLKGARAIKSHEKALRERALNRARVVLLHNPTLKLVGQPGETEEAFRARCAAAAQARGAAAHAALVAKHEPRIQKLVAQRDTAQRAAGLEPMLDGAAAMLSAARGAIMTGVRSGGRALAKAERARAKIATVEASLQEVVGKRNAELAACTMEAQEAMRHVVTKEVRAKADALRVDAYGIAWIAM